MRIQAFIFNWPGEKQHAAKLEAMLRQNCEVSVINSDDSMRNLHPHWCHIGSDGYFTDQWNAALERFDGDVLLHVQADVWPHDVGPMLAECVRYMRDHDVGVYAPDIVYTSHVYRRESLAILHNGVYEVPSTDCSCWAITAEVLRNTPAVDPEVNRLGWGIDFLVAAVAKRMGRKVVRDYRFRADHPKSRGYDSQQALKQWNEFKQGLDPVLRKTMDALELEHERVVLQSTSDAPASPGMMQPRSRFVRAARALRSKWLS